jgi:hypothetical protein
MFVQLGPVVDAIQSQHPQGICLDFFTLREDEPSSHVQNTLSSAVHAHVRGIILQELPLTIHRQTFRGSDESYSSLSFNSSIRDITKKGALRDEVFRFAFARRSLYPVFPRCVCKCGAILDPTGAHILVCRESRLFLALHTALLDAIVSWMTAYIKRHSPSPFRVVAERGDAGDFHRCWLRHYYRVTKGPLLGKRADAVMFHETDQLRPFILDVTTVMITPSGSDTEAISASELLPMLDKAYKKKMDNYSGHHDLPQVKIVPLVVGRSGMIHPSSLLFFDYFICNAHSPSLSQAPTGDRLSLLHAIMNALHDTVAISFKLKYDDEIARAAMSRFPLQVVLSDPSQSYNAAPPLRASGSSQY